MIVIKLQYKFGFGKCNDLEVNNNISYYSKVIGKNG